jgi:hypothetical protein
MYLRCFIRATRAFVTRFRLYPPADLSPFIRARYASYPEGANGCQNKSGELSLCSAPQKNSANSLCHSLGTDFANALICFFVGLGSGGIGGSARAILVSDIAAVRLLLKLLCSAICAPAFYGLRKFVEANEQGSVFVVSPYLLKIVLHFPVLMSDGNVV